MFIGMIPCTHNILGFITLSDARVVALDLLNILPFYSLPFKYMTRRNHTIHKYLLENRE